MEIRTIVPPPFISISTLVRTFTVDQLDEVAQPEKTGITEPTPPIPEKPSGGSDECVVFVRIVFQ